jgi:hypothetical protein
VKKTRQNKKIERGRDSIQSERALSHYARSQLIIIDGALTMVSALPGERL